jgi:predicted porin
MGQLGEIDMGVILGADGKPENSAIFFQLLTNVSGSDYQFTAMRFAEQNLIGAGIQSALGVLGFWLEAAYVSGDEDYARASIGVDYAFSERVFGMIEYHFNGAGSNNPDNYLEQLDDTAYSAGGVFLLGKNYLIPVISWQQSTLLTLSLQTLANLDDGSMFLSMNAEYSLSDNLYMGLGYHHFIGEDFNFFNEIPNDALFEFGSEYGSNPDSIFVSLRYYF